MLLGEAGLGQLWQAFDTTSGENMTLTEEGDETAHAVRDAILAERGTTPDFILGDSWIRPTD